VPCRIAKKPQVRFEFISVLAHEMEAPIGAIEGYLYMLRDATLGAALTGFRSGEARPSATTAASWPDPGLPRLIGTSAC
jgi:signal transduction histidine kinase